MCFPLQGEVRDLRLPCWVEGMDEPLVLSLSCCVGGLDVSYTVQCGDEQPRYAP